MRWSSKELEGLCTCRKGCNCTSCPVCRMKVGQPMSTDEAIVSDLISQRAEAKRQAEQEASAARKEQREADLEYKKALAEIRAGNRSSKAQARLTRSEARLNNAQAKLTSAERVLRLFKR